MISFVIPCFNEEGNVKLIYEEIHRVFDAESIPVELVMVNDGSKDATQKRLYELFEEKRDKHLKIVRFSRNFGKEAAMLSGLKHTSGDFVCIIDADLQERPEVALQMYRILENDPEKDAVAAYQQNRKEGKVLSFFKKSFYRTVNKICEVDFYSGASDFRMLRRPVVDAILSVPEYHRFSKGIFSFVGFETYFMPYEAAERATGSSKWSFRSLFRYAIDGIVGYTTVPLRFSTVLGMLISLAAFIYLIATFVKTLIIGIDVPGYATTVGIMLLLGGIQLLMLGIIGEYLARAYIQGKNRPIYIEKEVLEGIEHGQTDVVETVESE
ncbi:MAG: glycosyltransferase family 2 protein [Lachnospiraceae bacterium]|nr:glycosyltransferase family 2 protein [Lachnospiraceae bacterium]MBR5739413.1 glycosyltransferase family 2 protein [Lachnospiraceae bacterium]